MRAALDIGFGTTACSALHNDDFESNVNFLRNILFLVPLLTPVISGTGAAQWVDESDVAISMRDGIVLRAEERRPSGSGPFPVLAYRTAYGKNDALKEYNTFQRALERGYAVVVQDVRGRYASDGEFVPLWSAKMPSTPPESVCRRECGMISGCSVFCPSSSVW